MQADFNCTAAPSHVERPARRKTRITIYLDDEVLAQFRSLSRQSGTGYQTLINAALRSRLVAASDLPLRTGQACAK